MFSIGGWQRVDRRIRAEVLDDPQEAVDRFLGAEHAEQRDEDDQERKQRGAPSSR